MKLICKPMSLTFKREKENHCLYLAKFGNRVKPLGVLIRCVSKYILKKEETKGYLRKECNNYEKNKRGPHSLFMGSICIGKAKPRNWLWRHLTKENFITQNTLIRSWLLTPEKDLQCNADLLSAFHSRCTLFRWRLSFWIFFLNGTYLTHLPLNIRTARRLSFAFFSNFTNRSIRSFLSAFSSAGKVLISMCRSLKRHLQ